MLDTVGPAAMAARRGAGGSETKRVLIGQYRTTLTSEIQVVIGKVNAFRQGPNAR
jgi:hypothetical protein